MRPPPSTPGSRRRRQPRERRRPAHRRASGGAIPLSPRRLTLAAFAVVVALAPALLVWSDDGTPAAEQTPAADKPGPVLYLRVDTIIQPVAAEFVKDGIDQALASGAEALVIELSTPGGLLDSTRQIFTAMLGADLPVVAYVAPQGAQAASAGFFILQAADIAAMAPGTNTGAAHPVGGQGETIEGTLGKKVEEDAAATIRSLAARNGHNVELAQSAVVESKSFTAEEALENGLIDVIADDLEHLLQAIDGRKVTKNGRERVLRTAGAETRAIEMTVFQRLRSIIVHPNVAYLLLSLGGLAVYFELSSPGAILPGVVGAICLILAFYAMSVLPVSYAGIAFLILAAILFLLEIKITSFGLLAAGGVVSLMLGSIMLFKSADPAIRVSLDVVAAVGVVAAAVVAFLVTMVFRVHRRSASTGREGMVHLHGVARTDIAPRGKVTVHGEIWDAESRAPVAAGQPVEVVEINGMLLRVEPAER